MYVKAFGAICSRSEGFRKLLREIEGGIDEGLRAGLKRVNEGYPYRFGVDAPGLVKLGEGEGLSYEDQLFCLEAQSRLKYMRVNREARNRMNRRSEMREGRIRTRRNMLGRWKRHNEGGVESWMIR
jgi:hypothetical protein